MLRSVLKGVLLTFTIFTAGYAVGKEVGVRHALTSRPAAGQASASAAPAAAGPKRVLVARYYHSTQRCVTCNKIEAYAEDALQARFPEELADGRIVWEVANMDDAWNADAVLSYGLIRSSLVFLDMREGEEEDYSVLNQTWDLVGNKERFFDYIQSQVEMVIDAWGEDHEDEG